MIESRRFLPLLAAAGLVILAHQALDIVQLLPGTDFATPAGRVRQLLAAEARSPGLLTGDLLLIWAMLAGGKRRLLRTAGGLHLVLGLVLLALAPLFLGDAGSVAGSLSGDEVAAFRVVVTRVLLMLTLLGAAGLLAARALIALPRGWPGSRGESLP